MKSKATKLGKGRSKSKIIMKKPLSCLHSKPMSIWIVSDYNL